MEKRASTPDRYGRYSTLAIYCHIHSKMGDSLVQFHSPVGMSVEKFGSQPIDPPVVERIEGVTRRPLHCFLRRGIYKTSLMYRWSFR